MKIDMNMKKDEYVVFWVFSSDFLIFFHLFNLKIDYVVFKFLLIN